MEFLMMQLIKWKKDLNLNLDKMENNAIIDVMKKATVIVETQRELIDVLYSQVIDLTMMSKIELGDDVIAEIQRLKAKLKEHESTI
jgi:hypothetical protein